MAGRTSASTATFGNDAVNITVYCAFHHGIAVFDDNFVVRPIGSNKDNLRHRLRICSFDGAQF
jgi:hypothetical protein